MPRCTCEHRDAVRDASPGTARGQDLLPVAPAGVQRVRISRRGFGAAAVKRDFRQLSVGALAAPREENDGGARE